MAVTFSGRINPTGRFRVGPAGGAVAGPDPYWGDTVLLVNGDGDQWFSNKAPTGQSVAISGNVTPTESGKFGSGIALNQTGNNKLRVGPGVSFSMTDLTLELWVLYEGHMGPYGCLWSSGGGAATYVSDDLSLTCYTNGETFTSPPQVIIPGAWNHIAVVREATVGSLYVNGTRVLKFTSPVWHTFALDSIGAWYYGGYGLNGIIDEIRFSSVARYTGDTYTVPTAAFPVG